MKIFKDGEFKDVKSVNVFKNGEWQKERNAYIYHNGRWMSLIEYMLWIYDEGKQFNPLDGDLGTNGEMIENEDHIELYLRAGGGNGYDFFVNTQTPVDLTSFKNLYIDWSVSAGPSCQIDFGVGINKDDSLDVKKSYRYEDIDRKIDSIDISDLVGEFYIKSFVSAKSFGSTVELTSKIYKIWLE